jgi:hypothetical protein
MGRTNDTSGHLFRDRRRTVGGPIIDNEYFLKREPFDDPASSAFSE